MKLTLIIFIGIFPNCFGVIEFRYLRSYRRVAQISFSYLYQFLQSKHLENNFFIDPDFGNITKLPDNETHIGAITIHFFKEITNFVIKLKAISANKQVVMNQTIKPCDQKWVTKRLRFAQRSKTLMLQLFSKDSKDPPKLECPLKVSTFILHCLNFLRKTLSTFLFV